MPTGKKFGRKRPLILPHLNAKIPRFGMYLPEQLKAAPTAATWVKSWPGILGDNDKIGSCGPTALANLIKCQSMNATGTPIIIDTADIVTFYSAVSGYNPAKTNPVTGSNPTDEGVNLQDMLEKAQTVGIGGHKVLGFAAVDPSNTVAMQWASIVGCGLMFGWNLPQSAINQTDDGQPWTYVPGSPIVGGHATANYGYVAGEWDLESWADAETAAQSLLTHDLEECYVVLTDAGFNNEGVSACGLNEAALMSDFAWFAKNATA
jgi:hypothetical protein